MKRHSIEWHKINLTETIEALAKIHFTEIKKKDVPKSESTTSSINMDVLTLLQKCAVVYNKLLEDTKESNTTSKRILAQSDILWDTLRRSQRHINTGLWPDFGSGGFTSGASLPWHFPKSRDGGSNFNLLDMGGFSSRNTLDGFSTGGGF